MNQSPVILNQSPVILRQGPVILSLSKDSDLFNVPGPRHRLAGRAIVSCMKRAILAFLCCVIAATPAAHAGTTGVVTGVVTDKRGLPLANVAVHIVAPSQTGDTITDARGFFVFPSLTPDTYTVIVKRSGYHTQAFAGVIAFADQSLALSFQMESDSETIFYLIDYFNPLVKPGVVADIYTRHRVDFSSYPNQLMMQLQTVPGLVVRSGSPVVR